MSGTNVFSLLGKLAIDGVDETKKALDDVSKSGEDTKKKLNVSFKDIGNKAGELGKKMALGLAGVVTASVAGVEATREFRQDLGKLQTSFSLLAEGGVKQGTKTFKELYAVLGEDDTSIEAANNLVALTGDSKNLSEWTNILTGVYSTFGDSLPIEGLAEAANETARVGQVTGPLADALNWASMDMEYWNMALGEGTKEQKAFSKAINEGLPVEDAFNAALAETSNASEREALIRKSLNLLYGESGELYKETNKSVMDNNTAQAELNLKMADTMTKIEPLITKGKLFLADVLLKMQPAISWIINNINILAPIILTFIGSLFALNIASKIMNFIPIIKALFSILSANPIVLIITAIIVVIGLLIANWDKVKEVASNVWNTIKEVWGAVAEWFKTNVIDPVINFFTGLWEGLKAIWDGIVNVVKFAFNLIVAIIKTYFQLITLPFRFIWENCKETIMKIFNAIKDFIVKIWDGIKGYFTTVFNIYKTIFTTVFNAIKSVVTTVIEAIKGVIEKVFNAIKSYISSVLNVYKTIFTTVWNGIKTAVSTVVNGIKNTVSSVFNSLKGVVTTVWNGIKNAITKPIEKARDIIKGIVDKIKGFFKFNISLPKIKMPHFSISPSGWKIGDLLKGSIPKLGIDWYAKAVKNPMLLDDPTAFGFSPSGNIRVGGEAGSEIVGGTSTIMGMISNAVSSNNGGMEQKLDRLINLLTNYLPVISEKQVVLSTGELVGAMVNPMDKALAEKSEDRRRGR